MYTLLAYNTIKDATKMNNLIVDKVIIDSIVPVNYEY